MNNENNNLGNQMPNNNQNNNLDNQIQNNNEFNPVVQQYQQQINPQTNLNNTLTNNNYSPVTSQFNNQQPITQQSINNNQMSNSSNQTIYNNQMSNGSNQTSYNNQQSMHQNQPDMNNNVIVNKKSNKGKLFLFLGIGITIFIAIIIAIIVLISRDNKDANINEYETNSNTNNNASNEGTNTSSLLDVESYKGFNFKKLSGYKYVIDNDLLVIRNDNYAFLLTISSGNFNNFKTNYQNSISADLKNRIVGQQKIQTYSGVEIATYEISIDNKNAIYYILSSPNQNYCFEGYVMSRDNTFNYSTMDELIKLTSNAEYTGNFTNYSSNFGIDVDVKDIIEN